MLKGPGHHERHARQPGIDRVHPCLAELRGEGNLAIDPLAKHRDREVDRELSQQRAKEQRCPGMLGQHPGSREDRGRAEREGGVGEDGDQPGGLHLPARDVDQRGQGEHHHHQQWHDRRRCRKQEGHEAELDRDREPKGQVDPDACCHQQHDEAAEDRKRMQRSRRSPREQHRLDSDEQDPRRDRGKRLASVHRRAVAAQGLGERLLLGVIRGQRHLLAKSARREGFLSESRLVGTDIGPVRFRSRLGGRLSTQTRTRNQGRESMKGYLRKSCLALGVLTAAVAAGPAAAAGFGAPGPKKLAQGQSAAPGMSARGKKLGLSGSARGESDSPEPAKNNAGLPSLSSCPSYTLSRPFLAWGDTKWYTLLRGEGVDSFSANGWQLRDGAKVVTTKLADGISGTVLDLPSGASAVSPALCVNASAFPVARAMVADVAGSRGVAMSVAYASSELWGAAKRAGNIKDTKPGWARSKPIMLHAGPLTGIHFARFTFVASHGEYRVYDFYVDPRMSH